MFAFAETITACLSPCLQRVRCRLFIDDTKMSLTKERQDRLWGAAPNLVWAAYPCLLHHFLKPHRSSKHKKATSIPAVSRLFVVCRHISLQKKICINHKRISEWSRGDFFSDIVTAIVFTSVGLIRIAICTTLSSSRCLSFEGFSPS